MGSNNAVLVATQTKLTGVKAKSLAKAIFDAEVPEDVVKSLPAQSLYLAIKANGLESSLDLLQMASVKQYRLLLDFEFWQRDRFTEENFWDWARVCEQDDSLESLQKLLSCIDLKIISILISKNITVLSYEEPTDNPPYARSYTPDKGHTWITINLEDQDQHRIMGKLLALLFETSAELFYQIINIPTVSTISLLEEDSYNDRLGRLSEEGFPDREFAAELNSRLGQNEFLASINNSANDSGRIVFEDIQTVTPLVYQGHDYEPLTSLVNNLIEKNHRDKLEAELSLLVNAAILHWAVEFYNEQDVLDMAEKVKGAVNIGLEIALKINGKDALELHAKVGLKDFYRLGLARLIDLRNQARKTLKDFQDLAQEKRVLLENLSLNFPVSLHAFSAGKFTVEENRISTTLKIINKLDYLEQLENFVSSYKKH